ncbi:MAG TPA: CopG family transcriptional regulator [Firmicutes bacterium]|nr:CopG family transcriptional regulator [Bacillota bacterium]
MNKEVIYVRIDSDLKVALDALALDEQRSLNNLVVRILTQYIEEKEKAKKKEEVYSI